MKPDVIAVTPFYQPVMEGLEGAYTVHRLFEAQDRKAFLAGVKDKAQAIATFGGTINAELMDALPKLEIIACMSVGVDHVDLAAAKARGIRVTNAPDVLTDDVADIAIALLLGVARQIPQADRYVREGKWAAKGAMPLATKLGGATMGVLGLGRIGEAVAKRAEALGIKIVYHGPRQKPGVAYRYYADLVGDGGGRGLPHDVLSGRRRDAQSRQCQGARGAGQEGRVINIARGSVVDEPALVKALVEGNLGGAGLDVFADEPRVPEALFKLDNVVLLPHIGSATHATRRAMGQLMLDNLAAHFAGKPLLDAGGLIGSHDGDGPELAIAYATRSISALFRPAPERCGAPVPEVGRCGRSARRHAPPGPGTIPRRSRQRAGRASPPWPRPRWSRNP